MIIYLAKNIKNNKVYVGKTTQTLARRQAEHFYKVKKGHKTLFYNALRKYGFESFVWSVVHQDISTEKELNKAEIEAIVSCQSNDKKYGYNLTHGGDGTLGLQPMLGKKHTSLTKEKMSKARMGKIPWNKGVKNIYSKEALNKMAVGAKNRGAMANEKIAISKGSREFLVFGVITNELIGSWINKSECEKCLKLTRSSISTCLSGKQKTSGGYAFRYVGV